jgi:nicotinate-nucleotide pyrophosphorylase (carboxylating)
MPVIAQVRKLIEDELALDRIHDDVTTKLILSNDRPVRGVVRTREIGVFHGEMVIKALSEIFSQNIVWETLAVDGAEIRPGDSLVQLDTLASTCLVVERTLINILAHLCGVATLTRRYVNEVGDLPTKILATRKTLPGLRELQLGAVRSGGGWIHRRNLSDGILIKDNHQTLMAPEAILEAARKQRSPLHRIEIEVQSLDVLERVLESPPEIIMLDNLPREDIRKAMQMIKGRSQVEVSGGIRPEQVRPLAELGVNYISVGKLTHSAPSLDLTLDVQWETN